MISSPIFRISNLNSRTKPSAIILKYTTALLQIKAFAFAPISSSVLAWRSQAEKSAIEEMISRANRWIIPFYCQRSHSVEKFGKSLKQLDGISHRELK